MSMLPEGADPKVRRYFEYYNRRLQGESIEEIVKALGFCRPDRPWLVPTDLYLDLKRDGFPICQVCGETPAPIGHCGVSRREAELADGLEGGFAAFALRRMEDLRDAGFSERDWRPGVLRREGASGKGHPVILPDGQRALVQLHGWGRDEYEEPRVLAEPLKTDRAILAALVVLEAEPVNAGRVWTAHRVLETLCARPGDLETAVREDPQLKAAKVGDFNDALRLCFPIRLLSLLDFGDLPQKERVAALQRLCGYVNDLLEAARKVQAFLEHGDLPKKRVENPQLWILAAELEDALGLNHREVGEVLGVSVDRDYYAVKGTNKKVADMAKKGRELLMQAVRLEEVYRDHLAAVKPALEHWYLRLKEANEALRAGNVGRFIELKMERLESQEHLLLDIYNSEDKEGDEDNLLELLSGAMPSRYLRDLDGK